MARVCVEIDLLKPKVDEFWIGINDEKRLQRVVYEKFPKYCVHCLHLGGLEEECYANGNRPKPQWNVGKHNVHRASEDLRVSYIVGRLLEKRKSFHVVTALEVKKHRDVEGFADLAGKEGSLSIRGNDVSKNEQDNLGDLGSKNLEVEEQEEESEGTEVSKTFIEEVETKEDEEVHLQRASSLIVVPTQAANLAGSPLHVAPKIVPSSGCPLVVPRDNSALLAMPTMDEVKRIIGDMGKDSTTSPNGFSMEFYVACWKIIKEDVYGTVFDFFQGGSFPKGMVATTIVLIPKVDNAQQWLHFIPISLFAKGVPPIIHLGVPIFAGNKKACYFQPLLEKVRRKLLGWNISRLSHGGRLLFTQSVLASLPYYLLQVLLPPLSILHVLEMLFARFSWGLSSTSKKTHLISWAEILPPSVVPLKYHAYPCWHWLLKIRNVAETHVGWFLGSGEIKFWYDIWLDVSSLYQSYAVVGNPDCKVAKFLNNLEWDAKGSSAGVADGKVADQIGAPDRIFWKPSLDGRLKSVNTISVVRLKKPYVGGFKLNIDGYSKGNPGLSSYGVIIHDHDGCLFWQSMELLERGLNVRSELLDGYLVLYKFDDYGRLAEFWWKTVQAHGGILCDIGLFLDLD
ncbi:hypothetical protein ZIOFF_050230 [Zingiber officinale]|uniref:Uncharacterized protein n=1 Tax=Zingiber officinale TaxID=94328 RepID=A0A8J5KR72_ZINOF|nr:hypothetical protein ZIOFF_050230 [Zingiber officinale]